MRELFERLVRGRNRHLTWGRIPDANLPGSVDTGPLEPNQSYVVLRLSEMFLRDRRVLWRTMYPVVHAYVEHGGLDYSEVAGPGQLKELGSANLDRVVGLSYPLTDVIVYDGTDLDLLIGLYAVPSGDAAALLLDSLAKLSAIAGISVEVAGQVANVVKSGVEGMLQIDGTTLQLGVRDTWRRNPPDAADPFPTSKTAKAGFFVAMDAPAGRFRFSDLFVHEGRLLAGRSVGTGAHFDACDYMLLEIERREERSDWRMLPEIARAEKEFDEVIRTLPDPGAIRAQINGMWPKFLREVRACRQLTHPDMDRVIARVRAGLKEALSEASPFEAAPGGLEGRGRPLAAAGFDLMRVEDYPADEAVGGLEGLVPRADSPPF